jgi:hypothetical protein
MNKLFKVTEHKYLNLTIQESPFFVLKIQQIFANNASDFLAGIYNIDNPAMGIELVFPEFVALEEFMVDWIREMKTNTDVMNQLIENKKEE